MQGVVDVDGMDKHRQNDDLDTRTRVRIRKACLVAESMVFVL